MGISKQIKGKTIGLTTQFGGTEGFIAPEKILGRKLDIRSDLYSLGVVLSCLISLTPTSRPAFLTQKAIGKAKKLIASRFEPGVRSVTEHDSVL